MKIHIKHFVIIKFDNAVKVVSDKLVLDDFFYSQDIVFNLLSILKVQITDSGL